jgi:AcrR family transcriptional regulator
MPQARSSVSRRRAATPSAAGETAPLSLESIVDVAIELVEEHGYAALTMRRIADRLGVGAMTLYGYFRTKEQLLGAVADRMLGQVELPTDQELPWQEQAVGVLSAVHALLTAHPQLAEIVARQSVDGLSASRCSELLLGALRQAGLDDRQAVLAYDALSAFTVAFALREAARREQTALTRQRLLAIDELPAQDYSNVRELSWLLVGRGITGRFEEALRIFLRGLEATIND